MLSFREWLCVISRRLASDQSSDSLGHTSRPSVLDTGDLKVIQSHQDIHIQTLTAIIASHADFIKLIWSCVTVILSVESWHMWGDRPKMKRLTKVLTTKSYIQHRTYDSFPQTLSVHLMSYVLTWIVIYVWNMVCDTDSKGPTSDQWRWQRLLPAIAKMRLWSWKFGL